MNNKEQIKELFINHLKTLGYPNIDPQVVLNELLTLYKLLDNSGLKPEGLTFPIFKQIAIVQFLKKGTEHGI